MGFCLCTIADIDACISACDSGSGGRPAIGGAAGTAGGGVGAAPTGGASAGGSGGSSGSGGASGGGSSGTGNSGGGAGLSCVGHCGSATPVGNPDSYCFCDAQCTAYGDCCADYATVCTAGSGGSSGSGGSGGAGGATNDCGGWPSGSTGASMGKTLKQTLSWQGFKEYSSTAGNHSIEEFYDCDGSKGINALLFITATATCGICKAEAKNLEAKMAAWEPMGIKVVSLILYPSGISGAEAWKTSYGLTKSSIFSDKMPPSMAYSSTIGTPLHTIVNPRNMQVVYTQMGGGSTSYTKLEQLAQQNQQ
jgi:hypothetical protein